MKCIKGCLEIIVDTWLVVDVKLQESSYTCEFLFYKELSCVSMNMEAILNIACKKVTC
jgi:hypothetical protein